MHFGWNGVIHSHVDQNVEIAASSVCPFWQAPQNSFRSWTSHFVYLVCPLRNEELVLLSKTKGKNTSKISWSKKFKTSHWFRKLTLLIFSQVGVLSFNKILLFVEVFSMKKSRKKINNTKPLLQLYIVRLPFHVRSIHI